MRNFTFKLLTVPLSGGVSDTCYISFRFSETQLSAELGSERAPDNLTQVQSASIMCRTLMSSVSLDRSYASLLLQMEEPQKTIHGTQAWPTWEWEMGISGKLFTCLPPQPTGKVPGDRLQGSVGVRALGSGDLASLSKYPHIGSCFFLCHHLCISLLFSGFVFPKKVTAPKPTFKVTQANRVCFDLNFTFHSNLKMTLAYILQYMI